MNRSHLIYAPEVKGHLEPIDRKHHSLIRRTIEEQLSFEPDTETRKPMKTAPVAEVKAHFSEYVKESEKGPVVVTRNGRPAVVMIAAGEDDDELERLEVELGEIKAALAACLGVEAAAVVVPAPRRGWRPRRGVPHQSARATAAHRLGGAAEENQLAEASDAEPGSPGSSFEASDQSASTSAQNVSCSIPRPC